MPEVTYEVFHPLATYSKQSYPKSSALAGAFIGLFTKKRHRQYKQ